MARARFQFGAAVIAERVFVAGGIDAIGETIQSGEVFSKSLPYPLGIWTTLEPLIAPRARCMLGSLGATLVLLGGVDGGGQGSVNTLNTSVAGQLWSTNTVPSMTIPIRYDAAVVSFS